jgi:TonB family protein
MERWLKSVSDMNALPCAQLFSDTEAKLKYAQELTFQMRASTAAFVIEHPDEAENPDARIGAGLTGVLKTYQSLRKLHPEVDFPFLNLVLTAREAENVRLRPRAVMERCSDVPLSDANRSLSAGGERIYAPIEVSTPAAMTSMPFPVYTTQAKQNRTQGQVELHVVLASSGKVGKVRVVKGLPNGLTESSVIAAKSIEFTPAKLHQQPVSMLVRVVYNFLAR